MGVLRQARRGCEAGFQSRQEAGARSWAIADVHHAQVRGMTGWTKTGGFYGAIKRAGLTLTKDAGGVYHAA